jgi:hypothetical protein
MSYRASSTEWLAGSLGLSVHWTSHSQPGQGEALGYQEAVARFDLKGFIDQLKIAGVRHLIFTVNHARHYIAGPHPELDSLLPGHTCSRDLLGELGDALQREGIRLIFYYNHGCNPCGDPAWMAALGYTGAPLDLFAERLASLVESLSNRYGNLVSGWWFDSCYSLDPKGPHNSVTTPMGDWQFPWETLTVAAKSGNPESLVAFNSGIDVNYLYTSHQDYYAGETTSLTFQPTGRLHGGLQLHQWTCIDNLDWVHSKPNTPFAEPLYSDAELLDFTRRITGVGGAATYNVEIDQGGLMNPLAIQQLKRLSEML